MNRRRADESPDLLPIMHPLYNMRECCKQIALLEDHLNNERKRCQDCIRKHFLTIEALLEEAISLDNKAKWTDILEDKPEVVRKCQERWIDGDDEREIAQDLRVIRKDFAPMCFDLREMTEKSRMASLHVVDRYLGRNRHVCGSSNPIRALRGFVKDLNILAEEGAEINTQQNRALLAKLMKAADEALTGKPMTGRLPYDDYARDVLDFETVVMHLADGGWSRLVVTVIDDPYVWLSDSQPTVVQNWKFLRG